MRLLEFSSSGSLFVACKDFVVIVDMTSGSNCAPQLLRTPSNESSEAVLKERQKSFNQEDRTVCVVAVAQDPKMDLAFVAYSDKSVRGFNLRTTEVVSTTVLPKRPT